MSRRTSSIDGVIVSTLEPKPDHRGVFVEVFRASWPTAISPVQWNLASSEANVLRGFHVHAIHGDYLTVLAGELVLGLRDIRPQSPTHNTTEMLALTPQLGAAVTIPPGVAHGFYFPKPSMHLYCVSHYWDNGDEMGCRWDDADIELPWPTSSPVLSERDKNAGTFRDMVAQFLRRRAKGS